MPRIIQNGAIVDDPRTPFRLPEGASPETVALPAGLTLLPLAVWLARRDDVLALGAPAGVWLDSNEGPEAIAADLGRIAVVGVNFPKFTDGRGYSTARLLRDRYAYRGEIRAIGDVLHDQLFYMKRCGFDAFALRADQNVDKALTAFRTFGNAYQAAVDQPQPLFRRRAA